MGGARVELDALVISSAVPGRYIAGGQNRRQKFCKELDDDDNGADGHLYKSSDPIGLQSLSADPCSTRKGVLCCNRQSHIIKRMGEKLL